MIDDLSSLSSDDLAALSAAVPGLSSTFSGLANARAMPTSAPAAPPMASQQQQPPPQMMPGGIDTSGIYSAINSILRQQTSPSATASWGTSPLFQGMLGLAQGFGQAAMPTPYRMPFGAVIGMGAGGLSQGLAAGQQAQVQQAQLQQERMKNLMTAAALPMSLQQLQYKTNILQQIQTPEGRARLGMPDLNFSSLGAGNVPAASATPSTPPAPVASGTTMDTSTIQPASGWSMYAALPPEKQKIVDAAAAQHPEIPGYRDLIANHIWNESRGSMTPDRGDGGKAFGVMQMHADTLAGYNSMHGTNYTTDDIEKDPALGAKVGADYWADLYKQNNNNPFIASLAYAIGPGGAGSWIRGGADFSKLDDNTRRVLGNVYGPGSFPGATPIPDALSFNARRNQATQPNVAPTGWRTADVSGNTPPPANANLTPAPPSPAAVSDANAIASRVSGAGGPGGGPGGGTAVAQTSPLAPPAGPSPLTPPASTTAPPGGSLALPQSAIPILSPQSALAQAQRLNRAAMLGDLVGMPLFGDPQMLREQAQVFLKYGLSGSQKALEAVAEANVKLQYAGPTAYQEQLGRGLAQQQTEPELQRRVHAAVMPFDMKEKGWDYDPDTGNVSPTPGMGHDPLQIGAEEAAKQQAQMKVNVQFARQLAVEQNLGKPVTISRQGEQVGIPQRDGSYLWYQNPTIESLKRPDGSEYRAFVAKPPPDAPAGTQAIVTPITGDNGQPLTSEISPEQRKFLEQRGGQVADRFEKADQDAETAKTQNYMFDNMRRDSLSWTPDKLAPALADARSWMLTLGHKMFGLRDEDMPQITGQVADFNSFSKNAGTLLREAVHATSPRASTQEMQMIGTSLPTAETPRRAFAQLADQWQGINDYKIAKQQFAANYTGNPTQMEAAWNAQVNPAVFMLHRMYQTPEGQDDIRRMTQQLMATGHKQDVSALIHDYQAAEKLGLFKLLPGIEGGGTPGTPGGG